MTMPAVHLAERRRYLEGGLVTRDLQREQRARTPRSGESIAEQKKREFKHAKARELEQRVRN